MKSSYEERAKRFIEKIYPFIEDVDDTDEYELAVRMFNKQFNRKVRCASGQTRVALITSDYVVKIDYGDRGNLWGTSMDEVRHYEIAEREGYAYLFAKITPFLYKGHYFFIMPRVYGIGANRSLYMDVDEWLTYREADWIFHHVHDIHYMNYGWKNDKPIIVDYACDPM